METTIFTAEFDFTDSDSSLFSDDDLPVGAKTEPLSEEFQEIYQNSDVQPEEIKTEPDLPVLPVLRVAYKCRICKKMFDSKYAFTIHIDKHQKKCLNCKCVYQTWKELENHEVFCPRRFGRMVILPRPPTRPVRQRKRPHKCSLCKRRYEKYEHLFKHQVHRCTKRYVTSKWVVKI